MTKNRKQMKHGGHRESFRREQRPTINIPLSRYDYLVKCEGFLEYVQGKALVSKLDGSQMLVLNTEEIPHYSEGV